MFRRYVQSRYIAMSFMASFALGLAASLSVGANAATATASHNYYCTFVGKNLPSAPPVLVVQASFRSSDCAASRSQKRATFTYYNGIQLRAGYVPLCGHVLSATSSVWEAIYAKAGTQAEMRSYFCGAETGWRLVPAKDLGKLTSG